MTRHNTVAVVFGATGGIGSEITKRLARICDTVVAIARDEHSVQKVHADFQGAPESSSITTAFADITKPEEVGQVIKSVVDQYGSLDVVVNSAGTNVRDRALATITDGAWEAVLDVNLHGAFYVTQAALPHMVNQHGGLIIHVGSISAISPDGSGAAYQASKRGLLALSEAAMFEHGDKGIRVTVLLPGLVDTDMPLRRQNPPNRAALDVALQPADIADLCAFLTMLPPRCYIPAIPILPVALQVIGRTTS